MHSFRDASNFHPVLFSMQKVGDGKAQIWVLEWIREAANFTTFPIVPEITVLTRIHCLSLSPSFLHQAIAHMAGYNPRGMVALWKRSVASAVHPRCHLSHRAGPDGKLHDGCCHQGQVNPHFLSLPLTEATAQLRVEAKQKQISRL